MSTDKYIFPQVVAPWMDAAKPTPEQVSTLIHDWANYGIRADILLREQAARIIELEAQLAALTHAIVERDLIIGQYIAEVQPPLAGEET